MKYCHQCGTSNHEQAAFCRNCGTMLRRNKPVSEMPPRPEAPTVPAYDAQTVNEHLVQQQNVTQRITVEKPVPVQQNVTQRITVEQPVPVQQQGFTQVLPAEQPAALVRQQGFTQVLPAEQPAAPVRQQGFTQMLPAEQPKAPVQQPPAEKAKKKSKKGLVIGIAVGACVLIGAATAGILYWQSQKQDGQQSVEETSAADLDDDAVAALRNRIETARSEFDAGTKEYTAFLADLETIEEMGVEEVAEDIAAAREYATKLNDSRIAFTTAETLFGEEDYLEAREQYALVIEEDSNYVTAKGKSDECVNKYREKMLADAAAYADEGNYDSAITVLDTALTNLPGDASLQEQLDLYSQANHVYEDGKCKDCGAVDESYEGLMKASDGSWYYARGGKMDTSFTGLCKRNGFFYYVKDGKLDWSFTGLAKHDDAWYYMVKGELANTYTGLVKHSVTFFYVKNGKVDDSYTGLYKQDDIWYYIERGEHKRAYTGLCRHDGTWYYVSNGQLDRSYNGTYRLDGITYTIKNGVVQ